MQELDLKRLNDAQKEAVRTINGPLLLLAGAGTGKTTVITYRITNIIRHGIPAKQILAVTFTNKAAAEMKTRAASMINKRQANDLTVSTFHAFGLSVLRKHANAIGYNNDFTLTDYGDQTGIIKEAMGKLGFLDGSGDASYYLTQVGLCKNKGLSPAEVADSRSAEAAKIGAIYEFYQSYLEAINVMDFDDLLLQTLRLWQKRPDILQLYRERFKYLMVDEFQDTNSLQMEIIGLLAGEEPNICVVGDDDQSIYSWRGAKVENILNFPQFFPGCKTIKLEQNYRSTNNILNCANKLIGINAMRHDKNLWSHKGDGNKVAIVRNPSADREGAMIGDYIREQFITRKRRYGDFAILFRSNHQSSILERHLRQRHIPYHLVGDTSFFERREIRDALAILQVIQNSNQNMSLLRIIDVPPRGIGSTSIKKIRQFSEDRKCSVSEAIQNEEMHDLLTNSSSNNLRELAAKLAKHRKLFFNNEGKLADKVEACLQDIGYLDGLARMYKPKKDAEVRYENVYELIHSIRALEESDKANFNLGDYLAKVTLNEHFNRKKEEDEKRDSVTLMTIHASKGLEFPCVFVAGMEQNLFPHERSLKEGGLAEERRLCYVALTRAQDELFVSWAENRLIRQNIIKRRKSQFLAELPADYCEEISPENMNKPLEKESAQNMLKGFLDTF